MDLGLKNKAVAVTGGSKGLGRAIALAFANEGANVAICARDEAVLSATAAELRKKKVEVYSRPANVGEPAELDDFLEGAHDAFGRIDVLVNNAPGWGLSDDEAGWQMAWNVDVMAAVRAVWKVVPWMKASGGGAIVHMSSIAGLEGGWSLSAYAPAKAALISHSKALAIGLAPDKIRVNVVAPGSIEFPGGVWEQVKNNNREWYQSILRSIPAGRLGTAEEVADAVVFLASKRASWITGACLVVDGGQHKANT